MKGGGLKEWMRASAQPRSGSTLKPPEADGEQDYCQPKEQRGLYQLEGPEAVGGLVVGQEADPPLMQVVHHSGAGKSLGCSGGILAHHLVDLFKRNVMALGIHVVAVGKNPGALLDVQSGAGDGCHVVRP